jgi:sporulation protein YlmC with PRC-barrel domain
MGMTDVAKRVIDAGLNLLDRQILDRDGMMSGNVDDLELTVPADGGPPVITAILAGPGALARRLGSRSGRWLENIHSRLHPSEQPGPARVAFGVVTRVGDHVEIAVSRGDLDVSRFEKWVRDHIIVKIPGARA